MNRRWVGQLLVIAAVTLGVIGWWAWSNATKTATDEQRVERITASMLGREANEIEPDRTLPLALFGLGALSVVCGTIVLATDQERRSTDR